MIAVTPFCSAPPKKNLNYLTKDTDKDTKYWEQGMIRFFFLLFFIVSSCQQKKRGVVCDRIDANSGQCTQQLDKVAADTPPPVTKPTPILPQLPPIETTDKQKEEEVTEITDQTLLKDIIIKSRCSPNEKCPEEFTCRITPDCGDKNLVEFNFNIQNYESVLCDDNDTAKVLDGKILKCGFLVSDESQGRIVQTDITSKLLNQGVCALYTIIHGYRSIASLTETELIPQKKQCLELYSSNPAVDNRVIPIELTFSLSP